MNERASTMDQCPTTTHARPGAAGADAPAPTARAVSASSGRAYWRSLDDLAGSAEFREYLQREFPAYASELLDGTRRHFLKIMGAGLALAGAATVPGCRRPDHKIVAYNTAPEAVIPGKATFYATARPLPGGGCEGLLAETHEGRPTKLEGNPLHPENLGKSSLATQAAILSLYDPDRDVRNWTWADESMPRPGVATWDAFESFARTHFPAFDRAQSKGKGLWFLVEKATSPSRDRLRARVMERWPSAKWLAYDAVDDEAALAGSVMAFGSAIRAVPDFAKANVILSLDADVLGGEQGTLSGARQFAAGRYRAGATPARRAAESRMSRVYVVESMMTLTGGSADHRFAVKPSRVGAVAILIAVEVLKKLGSSGAGGLLAALEKAAAGLGGADLPSAGAITALADDLVAPGNRGASVVVTGPSQPAAVHALGHLLNVLLGNAGRTVRYAALAGDAAASSLASITELSSGIDAGEVDTLVIIGANPAYTAPADLRLAEKLKGIAHSVHLGELDETAALVKMHLPRAHFLESWGDVEHWDGTYSVIQPMIAPLFGGRTELEVLAAILGDADTDPYGVVRGTVRARAGAGDVESIWRRTLHDGLMAGSTKGLAESAPAELGRLAGAVEKAAEGMRANDGVELLFVASPLVHDGRDANNGWLQELAHPVTKVCWDNPLLISPATAKAMGLSTNRHTVTPQYTHGQMVSVSVGGRSAEMAIWPQPGLAPGVVVAHLGYGRRVCGRIGAGTGFDAYALRASGAMRVAPGAAVTPAKGRAPYLLACTQDHWTLEGRDIIREVDLPAWQKHGDEDIAKDKEIQKDPYDRTRGLNFAGRLGMESHAPSNTDIYQAWQKRPRGLEFVETDEKGELKLDARGNVIAKKNKHGKTYQQWGMSIDMTNCTGCGACTIACQAENNIPIVGKMEVAKGREMAWIRIDRYYSSPGDSMGIGSDASIDADPGMMMMPVACVHCENAPCEVVCPVNATAHDPEGNNNMAYNRCIGTRYCSNNCPYKVRRFNWFDYGTKQFRGNYAGKEQVKDLPKLMQPPSEYFVPPRMREKKHEVSTMASNPNVTVRSRGVMEKCTYCIQRVNAARIETKLKGLPGVPDGFMQTACQQACPSNAIVFGDIYDHDAHDGAGSMVKQARNDARSYQLLSYLNTRPRTTHMLRLRNPNPAIRPPVVEPFGHHGGHGDEHHHAPEGGHGGDEHGGGVDPQRHSRGVISLPVLRSQGVRS